MTDFDYCYWTVTYEAEGRSWWAVGGLLGWQSIDEWTSRARLDRAAALEVYRVFKSNPKNERVRLVRVTRKTVPKESDAK
jgi:hypothetical protein